MLIHLLGTGKYANDPSSLQTLLNDDPLHSHGNIAVLDAIPGNALGDRTDVSISPKTSSTFADPAGWDIAQGASLIERWHDNEIVGDTNWPSSNGGNLDTGLSSAQAVSTGGANSRQ